MDRHLLAQAVTQAALVLTVAACHASEAGSTPSPGGTTAAETLLPERPESFRIELSGSACYGSCPTYRAAIDQDGNVTFVGETCVARPGVFTQKVAAKDARAVYDALRATNYAALGDRYTSMEDGCNLSTDSPTFRWDVRADDQEKPLERYAGCDGVEGLTEIDAVMPVFHERANLLRYLEPNPFNCVADQQNLIDAELHLSHAGAAAGVLEIARHNDWSGSFEFKDCSGALRARGDIEIENARWVLIDEERKAIALPNDLGEAGSLVIELKRPTTFREPASILGVTALRQDDDLHFDLSSAVKCAQ